MHERIQFIINPAARPNVVEKVADLAKDINADSSWLTQKPIRISDGTDVIGVVGGDGSYRFVMESLLQQGYTGTVLLARGGSANGLFHDLQTAGVVVSSAQLKDTDISVNKIPPFHPGTVNSRVFGHVAGWGKNEVKIGKLAEDLRHKIPRQLRTYAATALLFLEMSRVNSEADSDPFMQWALMGKHIGPKCAFPDNNLHGKTITLLTIPNKPIVKLALIFAAYPFLSQKTAKRLVRIEEVTQHTVQNPNTNGCANLDGELIPLGPNEEVILKRSDQSLAVAALKL